MDITKDNPDFLSFRNHPFVQSIASTRRWTFSTEKKMPVDMYDFEYHEGAMNGALYQDERSLVSLDKLHALVPSPPNYAFFLDALQDGFVVLDIEPSCPEDYRKKLLETPYVYGEVSMSGKGLHLVYPLPKSIHDYPNAKPKLKMLHERRYYEILLCHYITFTGRQIAPSSGTESFEILFDAMCREQKPSSAVRIADFDPMESKPDDIPLEKEILAAVSSRCRYGKTPEDFGGDLSRFEWGLIGKYYRALRSVTRSSFAKSARAEYTDDHMAWLLYLSVSPVIPHREKHDTMRGGMPFLLWRCYSYVIQQEEKGGNK